MDQLVEIIKVLGTPTREEIHSMNPNNTEFKFPQIKAHPWSKVFHKRLKDEALDMISHLLVYSPDVRFGGARDLRRTATSTTYGTRRRGRPTASRCRRCSTFPRMS